VDYHIASRLEDGELGSHRQVGFRFPQQLTNPEHMLDLDDDQSWVPGDVL
jgi:hypothetical protein